MIVSGRLPACPVGWECEERDGFRATDDRVRVARGLAVEAAGASVEAVVRVGVGVFVAAELIVVVHSPQGTVQATISRTTTASQLAELVEIAVTPLRCSDELTMVGRPPEGWNRLVSARHVFIGSGSSHSPRALLCGSFDPLHDGHRQLREAAERRLGTPVGYELSVRNVEKPPLDFLTIRDRVTQSFDAPVVLTNAPAFVEKARIFRGCTFVLGFDTAIRLLDPAFHGGSRGLDEARRRISACGGRFLVGGRLHDGRFATVEDLPLPPGWADLFDAVSESEFRCDISSTQIRSRSRPADSET